MSLKSQGRIIIDDGRRFLMRTREKFDVIIIDPPPPVEAAGTSLLYSTEFYALAKQHLQPGGILQPGFRLTAGNRRSRRSLAAGILPLHPVLPFHRAPGPASAGIVRAHYERNAADLAAVLPLKARQDLMEWSTGPSLQTYLQSMLAREIPIKAMLNSDKAIGITDDQPYNEYFFSRCEVAPTHARPGEALGLRIP